MFWRKIGKVIAYDDTCCSEDFAKEFVTSVSDYLKVSRNTNVGTVEEYLAFEATVKNKKGSPWLPLDEEPSPVESTGSATAVSSSEQPVDPTMR